MKKHFLFASLLFGLLSANAQVVINEIMQSNIDCIMDDLNDFPDSWVELYNAGDESVDLSTYRLGAKTYKKADQLPAYTLEPKAFVVLYCDKANDDWETYKAAEKKEKINRHLSFRLESSKDCKLYLYDKDKNVVDSLPAEMKKQPAPNIAFGRKNDGEGTVDDWNYQLVATPGAPNCGNTVSSKKILGNPVFSVAGKVFTSGSFNVEISLPEDAPEGTVIRYTTDGSEPTADSKEYTKAISVSSTKIINAKLFCDGMLSPRSTSQSYIKMDRDVTLPVFSIITDDKYLNDPQIGIYTDGSYTYPGSTGGWGDDPNEEKKNYFYNWRRPMNFEYFEGADVESSINQLGEARITGAYTRREALKSLCLYANKRFGEKRLNYEFFPDQRPGIDDFKSILLRNAGNDHGGLYMRDAIVQCSMAKYLDIDWQAWSPSIVFINGQYKGILNIRERSNEDNIYTNYVDDKGEGLEDIDMVENPWVQGKSEWKTGEQEHWTEFEAFYKEKGHSYEEFDKLMDVQEFMDVMIFSAFFYNTDFPGNNIVFWRPTEDGGRWRLLVKDCDFALAIYDGNKYKYDYYSWLYNPSEAGNSSDATRLFRRLMDDEDFKREFIDRTAIYVGDFMNYDRIWPETWEPMYETIKYEYSFFKPNDNPWWDPYQNNMNDATNFLQKRPRYVYDHLNSYFKVGTPTALTINKGMSEEDLEKISVKFNGWELSRGTFDGKFFAGREVTLCGENVNGWIVKIGSETTEVKGDTYTFSMPSSSVSITAVYGQGTGIEEISTEKESEVTDIYDASGMRRSNLQNGLNIIRLKDGTTKKVFK